MTIEIPLGRSGQFALVDNADREIVDGKKWYLHGGRKGKNYAATWMNGRNVFLHRLLMGVDGQRAMIDHINRDPLDNRRANLRLCNHSQNAFNAGAYSTNTHGTKGVSRRAGRISKPWDARIKHNGRNIWLGSFATAEEGHAAYLRAVSELALRDRDQPKE